METTGKKHTKTLDTLVPDINKLLTYDNNLIFVNKNQFHLHLYQL